MATYKLANPKPFEQSVKNIASWNIAIEEFAKPEPRGKSIQQLAQRNWGVKKLKNT